MPLPDPIADIMLPPGAILDPRGRSRPPVVGDFHFPVIYKAAGVLGGIPPMSGRRFTVKSRSPPKRRRIDPP